MTPTVRSIAAISDGPWPAAATDAQPNFVAKAVVWTLGLLAEECSLRAKGKARSLKVLLRTSVAASAIFAEAF